MIELLQQYLQFGPCLTSDYVSSLTPIFNVLLQTKLMMEFLKTRREKVSVLVCIRHPGHSAMLISRTS